MSETLKKPLFNADEAEEYFTNLCIHYREEKNRVFARDNEGRHPSEMIYSAESQKLLGMELAMREVLDYFSKFDLSPSGADVIDRTTLLAKINGPERPEINDGAQEVEWIMKCIQDAPENLDWFSALEHLDFYEAEYGKLNPMVGVFALARIENLRQRYENGERTQFLFDEIMSVE